jgi:hypothetical protein
MEATNRCMGTLLRLDLVSLESDSREMLRERSRKRQRVSDSAAIRSQGVPQLNPDAARRCQGVAM